jgi:hypothetical protein
MKIQLGKSLARLGTAPATGLLVLFTTLVIVAFPPASAGATPCHQYCGSIASHRVVGHGPDPLLPEGGTPIVVHTKMVPSTDEGFHWLDAAIGFGVACGAMLLSAGPLAARRRARATAAGLSG